VALLEFKLATTKDLMIDAEGTELYKLQGRAKELKELLKGLELKARKLDNEYTGAHGY
jgi:hypothetical protein